MPTEDSRYPRSILFVVTRGDLIGGAQIHVRDFSRALIEKGVRVAVACGTDGVLRQELAKSGIPFFLIKGLQRSINPLQDLLAIQSLVNVIKKFKPEIISTHTAKAGMVGRLAAFFTGIPALFTAHGWQFAEGISFIQKTIVLTVEWFLARGTKKIITVSGYDRELALKHRLAPPSKIHLIHNGMPWIDRPITQENDVLRLIMVARFQPQKDHRSFFEALDGLKDLSWVVDLVGDGPDMDFWRNKVREYSWADRVTFHGQVLSVPQLMEKSDIFVLSSLWEGFPRSIIEAMRAQLPVVCSDVGGVRESVIDDITGFVVPVRQPQVLAERLRQLLVNHPLRHSMGSAGRERFEKEFTFDSMLEKTRQVWQSALTHG